VVPRPQGAQMGRTRRIGVPTLVSTAIALGALAAATAVAPAAQASTPVVRASLNFATPAAGKTVSTLTVGGAYASALTASVVTANGGRAVSVVSGTGYNNAIAFPAYVPLGSNPPNAIVAIRNKSAALDPLDGGTGAVTWQADFYLANNLGSDPLDGDNILQRGLAPHKQWKLSVDRHQAQCFARTVAYSSAVVTPEITIPTITGPTSVHWYRAICNRSASGVLSLRVYGYSPTTRAWFAFRSSTAATLVVGDLDMDWSIPVSVGGKLTDSGAVALSPSPDQLNGSVDNVILSVG
jgi:hypothetical protein